MKNRGLVLTAFIILLLQLPNLAQSFKNVKIGSQIWMTENLNVEKFRNGDPIPHARKAAEWEDADKNKQPAWCYYDNNIEQGAKYGKLYNWYAVNDPRGLAPAGWHIPSDQEWSQLIIFLGGTDVSGIKLKSKSGFYTKRNATNQSGFSGMPGGNRSRNGYFVNEGAMGFWWTATEDYAFDNRKDVVQIWSWSLSDYYEFAFKKLEEHGKGFSVRCISGSEPKIEISNDQLNKDNVTNENKIFQANIIYNFKEVTIGNQIWMEVNLNSDKFRNGEPIPEAKTKEEWKYKGENKQPAWCYYNYESANGLKYGKLYNWYAVNDARALAPAGWHIPSDQEWSQLIIFLGGTDNAGIKIKSKEGWFDKTTCGTNESGFNGLPGGYCGSYGNSNSIGYNGFWWCSDEIEKFKGFYRSAGNFMNINACYKGIVDKMEGYSVRCIKNNTIPSEDINCELARKKYLEQNPDVAKAGMDAWNHYTTFGKREGRKWPACAENAKNNIQELTESNTKPLEAINCELARKKYLEQNPDVAKAGMDAWNHYTTFGKREGRKWPACAENANNNIQELTESQKAQLAQALKYIDNGNYLSSLGILNDLVNQSPSYYPLYIYRGMCKVTNDFDGAIKDMDLFINNSYGFETRIAMAYLFKGSSLIGLKNYDEGCKYLTLAKNSDESWIIESANKIISEYCGDTPKRIELTESQKIIYSKAIEESEKGNLNASLEYFNQLISESPNYFPSYILRASIKGQLHQYSQAVSDVDMFINNSVGYDPLLANAYRIKGAALIGLDKLDEGCKNLTLAINKGDAGAKKDFETLCNQKNKPTSPVSNSTCSFVFKKPILTITYVDNRTMCCYCEKKYAKYEERTLFKGTEELEFIGEQLCMHYQAINADDDHKTKDRDQFKAFIAKDYKKDFEGVFMTEVGIDMMIAYGEMKNLLGGKLGDTNRKFDKYTINSKFCSTECEDKCDRSQRCQCK